MAAVTTMSKAALRRLRRKKKLEKSSLTQLKLQQAQQARQLLTSSRFHHVAETYSLNMYGRLTKIRILLRHDPEDGSVQGPERRPNYYVVTALGKHDDDPDLSSDSHEGEEGKDMSQPTMLVFPLTEVHESGLQPTCATLAVLSVFTRQSERLKS